MALGLIGKKVGMTRLMTDEGAHIPVTVVQVQPNRVTQIKNIDTDGYRGVQITTGSKRAKLIDKATAGHLAKAKAEAGEGLWEFRLDDGEGEDLEVGGQLPLGMFAEGQKLKVTGTSKGKGYAGTIKRHNFSMQDATHGNSLSHRAPGSIGQCQTPGRVFKGKKMAGHMGDETVTIKNLELVKVDADRNLLLIKGAVPGAPGGHVVVRAL